MGLWALVVGTALAGTHTSGLGLSVGWHDSPRQVVIGTGPRLAHRWRPESEGLWQVGGAVERLWLVVPTFGFALEGGMVRPRGTWHPGVSVELAAYPSRLIKLTSEYPTPPIGPATSVRLRLRPLVFDVGSGGSVSALELAPGLGLDAPADTRAFGLTVFSVAHRW